MKIVEFQSLLRVCIFRLSWWWRFATLPIQITSINSMSNLLILEVELLERTSWDIDHCIDPGHLLRLNLLLLLLHLSDLLKIYGVGSLQHRCKWISFSFHLTLGQRRRVWMHLVSLVHDLMHCVLQILRWGRVLIRLESFGTKTTYATFSVKFNGNWRSDCRAEIADSMHGRLAWREGRMTTNRWLMLLSILIFDFFDEIRNLFNHWGLAGLLCFLFLLDLLSLLSLRAHVCVVTI